MASIAGEAIFEIGRRLKHVKENDLAHGEWSKWLESIRMDRASAHKLIFVYEEMGGENVETFQRLGMTALYQIATLPPAERQAEHVTAKGEAIFEIGRRLKHVKENDLAHGEWTKWCKEEIGMDRAQADKFIRVVNELGNEFTYTQLGMNALYQIATLPPEQREVEHTTSKGEAIFEIGRRLKHVKETLMKEKHGEWARWCKEEIGVTRQQADRFIVVFEELGSNDTTSSQIGLSRLYEIATLPPSEREAEHTTSKGETKTPVEMTVKELRDLKRQLRAEQAERERLEEEATRLHTENAELAGKEPEVTKIFRKIFYLRLLKF